MYRVDQQPELPYFYLPFGGKLDPQNRWVKLASFIPWHLIEGDYRAHFAASAMGAPAMSSRIALGALIIKERLGITDEETVAQIRENPYLQHFVGLHEYFRDDLFDPSMMVHFRKRISPESFAEINHFILQKAREKQARTGENPPSPPRADPPSSSPDEALPTPHPNGKLLIDATRTPADITYPTDLKLLNDAREKTERIIDDLHATFPKGTAKPRTCRREARKHFLTIALSKKPKANKIRTAPGKQLRYLKRNLGHIHNLLDNGAPLSALRGYWHKCLMVIHTLYDQQLEMYQQRSHRVADRIVSISQPHIRPIVRGKLSKSVEFGAEISVSHIDGMVLLERFSWDAYNETVDLTAQAESYRQRTGTYPASIHADKIYQNPAQPDMVQGTGHTPQWQTPGQATDPDIGRKESAEERRNRPHPHRRQIRQPETQRHARTGDGKAGNHWPHRHQHWPARIEPRHMDEGFLDRLLRCIHPAAPRGKFSHPPMAADRPS